VEGKTRIKRVREKDNRVVVVWGGSEMENRGEDEGRDAR